MCRRDKGLCGGREGALCLSSLESDPPTQDKHKAPASAPPPPLVPTKVWGWACPRSWFMCTILSG